MVLNCEHAEKQVTIFFSRWFWTGWQPLGFQARVKGGLVFRGSMVNHMRDNNKIPCVKAWFRRPVACALKANLPAIQKSCQLTYVSGFVGTLPVH